MEKATYCEKKDCIYITQGRHDHPCIYCVQNKYNNYPPESWYQVYEPTPEEIIKDLKQQLKIKDELINETFEEIAYLYGYTVAQLKNNASVDHVTGKIQDLIFKLEKSLKGE